MTQILKLTQVKTHTWTCKIKFCYIWSVSCYMSVTMALTVCIAQYWLKLLPAVMLFVQGNMYDSGVCYCCLFLRFHGGFYSLFLTWYEHSVELEHRSMVSFTVMCVECQGTFQNEVATDQDIFNQQCITYCYQSNRYLDDGTFRTLQRLWNTSTEFLKCCMCLLKRCSVDKVSFCKGDRRSLLEGDMSLLKQA
jgi:hypothetical protein